MNGKGVLRIGSNHFRKGKGGKDIGKKYFLNETLLHSQDVTFVF